MSDITSMLDDYLKIRLHSKPSLVAYIITFTQVILTPILMFYLFNTNYAYINILLGLFWIVGVFNAYIIFKSRKK